MTAESGREGRSDGGGGQKVDCGEPGGMDTGERDKQESLRRRSLLKPATGDEPCNTLAVVCIGAEGWID